MRVITLNEEEFDRHAERLAKAVAEGSHAPYDAIVGVRRGGSLVCDAFLRHFPEEGYGARYDVKLQRPSTKHKDGSIGKILKRLPYPILDGLRMAESLAFGLRRMIRKSETIPEVEIPDGLSAALKVNAEPKILLIDDAIDSGDTLFAIAETLKKMNPDAKTDIAVITETTSRPRIRANHTLYRNRTLIRFPWSSDYKNH